MANLVTVTRDGRLILKFGGIFLGAIFLIYILVKGGAIFRQLFFPKPPPPPAQAFGKLPHITFPKKGESGINYTVNTVDGKLPNLASRVDVYALLSTEPDLLALQKAKSTLDSMNFVENQFKRSDTLYQWTQSRTGIVINYNIVNKNFTINSNFLTNPSLISTTLLPSQADIIRDVGNYLKTIDAQTDNIDFEKTKVDSLELQNGSLVEAQNLGNARLARVTLVQKNVGDIPIIYGAPEDSLLTFIVSYPSNSLQLLDGIFYNYQIDDTKKSDYPIKSVEQALEDLKSGNAYIINPQNLTDVDITNVELKYYLPRENNGYLLPVFVFTGINFTGFVEALPATSIQDQLPGGSE